jgi:hypothetical protein
VVFNSEDFDGVSAGAVVQIYPLTPDGTPISSELLTVLPRGTTVTTKNSRISLTLSAAATITTGITLIFAADTLLVAQANALYQKAVLTPTRGATTYSTIEAVTAGTTLESVFQNNQNFLLNGANDNRALQSDGTTIPHGLQPVTAAPTITTTTGAWALARGTGFYGFWTTEYDKVNDIESDFIGDIATYNVSSTSTTIPIITRPARVNPTATHWRVYRSDKFDATTQQGADKEKTSKYPYGVKIGELELREDNTQISITDGGGATSSTAVAPTSGSGGLGSYDALWVNDGTSNPPTQATGAVDATFASVTGSSTAAVRARLELVNIDFAGAATPIADNAAISGITVSVKGKATDAGANTIGGYLRVGLGVTGQPWTVRSYRVQKLTPANTAYTLGGTSDLWGKPAGGWTKGDFATGKFSVFLIAELPAHTTLSTADKVFLDGVTVSVTFGVTQGGTAGTLGKDKAPAFDYPSVVITPFGITIATGRNGPPPRASTGDVFQDSLLFNDVTDATVARYSFPLAPHSWPREYFLKFPKDQGNISMIRTVGNIAIIAQQSQMHRANYLPRNSDAEFARGRAVETFEVNHGVAGPRAGCLFSLPDGAQRFIYGNRFGVFITEGYRTHPACPDLDWEALVSQDNVSKLQFVNNPELQCVEVYFVPVDAFTTTYPTRVLYLSYAPRHLKNGALKACGPITYTAGSSTLASLSNGNRLIFTGTTSGTFGVQYENTRQGMNDPVLKTRRLFLAGFGNEWNLKSSYVNITTRDYEAASPGTITARPDVHKTGAALRTGTPKQLALPTHPGLGQSFPKQPYTLKFGTADLGEGLDLVVQTAFTTGVNDRLSIDYGVLEGEDFGAEDAK